MVTSMAETDLAGESQFQRTWIVREHRPMDYAVHVTPGLLDLDLAGLVAITEAAKVPWSPRPGQRWAVVVDATVHDLYGKRIEALLRRLGFAYHLITLVVDEYMKTSASVDQLVAQFKRAKLRRRDRILVIGGGILCDLVGRAADGYRRGTPYWRIPTTLIAMVDVAAGVKNAVNVGDSKNILGGYYPCELSLVDPTFLASLPPRHLSNGMSEMIKVALGTNRSAFNDLTVWGQLLLSRAFQAVTPGTASVAFRAIQDALGGHLEALRPNLTERSLERALDLGHGLSGAVEMAALPDLLHGEAVALELALVCCIAAARGLLHPAHRDRVLALLHRLNLPLWHPAMTIERLSGALADTVLHRDGFQRFPLPGPIGFVTFVNDLTVQELEAALKQLQTLAARLSAANS
jgi:2-epi-5-epi-valiolone synthase